MYVWKHVATQAQVLSKYKNTLIGTSRDNPDHIDKENRLQQIF